MNGAIFPLQFANPEVGLLTAIVLGFFFGFSLERGEFGNARKLAAQFDTAVEERDMARIMYCDRLFHEAIAAASHNQVLIEILKVLHARSQRFWAISLSAEGHLAEVSLEHQAIISALEEGNAEKAETAANAHVASFRRSLVQSR